jgi:hypothetical protein
MAGLFLLANSRPLEGFLFSIPFLFALASLLIRSPLPGRQLLTRIVIPGVLLLGVIAVWMLFYNWRGTGHALTMPYMLNQVTYHVSRPFFFQKMYPPAHYNHPEMRAFYMFHELPDVIHSHTLWGIEFLLAQNFFIYYIFLVWPFLLLLVPGVILAARSRELRVVLGATLLMTLGLLPQIWPAHGHYAAPAAGALLLIVLNALRALGATSQPIWYRYFARAIVFAIFFWMLVPLADRMWNPYAFDIPVARPDNNIPRQIQRETLKSRLDQIPGQHLVLVHYNSHDIPSQDWIYNCANIDASKIVWARDMGREGNEELLRYYPTRQAWYVDRGSSSVPTPYGMYLSLTHPDESLLSK